MSHAHGSNDSDGSRPLQGGADPFEEVSDTLKLPLPRPFGSYTLVRSLGRGGMGHVYLARRSGLAQRLCVVKTVRADLLDDDDVSARFMDEARLAVNLTHTGICHVFDAGQVGDVLYIAMEHIAGVDLRDLLGARSRLPLGHGLFIMLELLDALDYAHEALDVATGQPLSIIHRDVSPQNVMVSFEGEVKLIDFGLASSKIKLTRTGDDQVMGKIAYMSPEQVQGGLLDARVDQYAAAIVGVELLTGSRFYEGKERHEVPQLVAHGGYRPPAMGELPAGVVAAFERALASARDERFPACREMAAALRLELSRIDPLMSRAALRAWVQRELPSALESFREQARGLPEDTQREDRTDAVIDTEQTQGADSASRSRSSSLSQKALVLSRPSLPTPRLVDDPETHDDGSARTDEMGLDPATVADLARPDVLGSTEPPRAAREGAGDDPSLEVPFDAASLELARPTPAQRRADEVALTSASFRAPRDTAPRGTAAARPGDPRVVVGAVAVLVFVGAVLAWMATRW